MTTSIRLHIEDIVHDFDVESNEKMQKNVTIPSRFRIDGECVVLARKHWPSILNQDCETVTPPA